MKIAALLLMVSLFVSCKPNHTAGVEELFETDRNFSALAAEKGYDVAFIEYAHPDAVLFRENSRPIVGKPAVIKQFENTNPEGIEFSWEPLDGRIAASGELGFTYGIYTIKSDSVVQKGTYISVWKKDENGKWKYILDSGNEGLGE